MTVSELPNPEPPRSRNPFIRPRVAALVMLGVLAVSAIVATGWFIQEDRLAKIWEEFLLLRQYPPIWLEVPMVAGEYLFVPTVALLVVVLMVMKISPHPRNWSRFIVVTLLLLLTARYVLWRLFSTLNFQDALSTVISVGLFASELLVLSSSTIQLFLMLNVKDRHRQADQLSIAVLEGSFAPTVDVLIPTYDEPTFILKRTIIGCQALEYPNKKIYLLDDTRRSDVKALAAELGCHYITRPDNRHAKAGNLNHAIAQISGELIAVFDADFVPTRNFLTRTVGFFQESTTALVQTPQSFYNADPIARNLGLEDVLTPEEEVFYRQVQPLRDGAGSVICSGTSFLVRRDALIEVGGFVTDSLSEDYFTGVRLSARQYHLVYLDEKLSAGLAAENISAHATQRLRWERGTLQAFFIESNPLTIKGLTLLQRLAHSEGILHWFTSLSRIGFLLMPFAYSFNVIPLRVETRELIYFFLPFYVVQFSVFSWLNYRSRSALLSDIYSLVLTFPLAITVIRVMLNPFSKGFKVTPKGTASDRYTFNWGLALPLMILFVLTAISLWRNLGLCIAKGMWDTMPPDVAEEYKGMLIGWILSAYNLLLIGVALLILMDVPKPDLYDWFDLRRTVYLQVGDRKLWGITTMMSEGGAEIAITQAGLPNIVPGEVIPMTLAIMEEQVKLHALLTKVTWQEDEFPVIRVQFRNVTTSQHRRLVEMLYCRPGQWKRRASPGELTSLFLLLKTLFVPRILFDRRININPIPVTKG